MWENGEDASSCAESESATFVIFRVCRDKEKKEGRKQNPPLRTKIQQRSTYMLDLFEYTRSRVARRVHFCGVLPGGRSGLARRLSDRMYVAALEARG